jgi:hypothetical protein
VAGGVPSSRARHLRVRVRHRGDRRRR